MDSLYTSTLVSMPGDGFALSGQLAAPGRKRFSSGEPHPPEPLAEQCSTCTMIAVEAHRDRALGRPVAMRFLHVYCTDAYWRAVLRGNP